MDKLKKIYSKNKEVIDYLFWGVVAFVLYMFIYWIFTSKMGMREVVATFFDNVIVIIFTFITNKLFVFRSKAGSFKGLVREFVSFVAARIFTFILNELIVWVGCDLLGYNTQSYHLPFINDGMIVQFIAQAVVIITNYVLSKLVVFRKKKTPVADDVPNTPEGTASDGTVSDGTQVTGEDKAEA
ncbi:MAG: GtrA family protein [Lachnospiraceae bacterium]|nr:GtrA family protein [Lachnospiraceae bacterium]